MASTSIISGNATKNNSGTAIGVGSTATVNGLSLRSTASNESLMGSESKIGSGVQSTTLGSAIAITAITQSGSTGKVNIQKSSHGRAVGDKVVVSGTDIAGYNVPHTVTVITDANNFRTDINYSANTSTHGSYYLPTGTFAKITPNKYVARVVNTELAGVANTTLRGGYVGAGPSAFAFARGNRKVGITSWNYVTGAATKSGAGDAFTYVNIATGSTLAVESFPSRSVPGKLTYRTGKSNPVSGQTPPITG